MANFPAVAARSNLQIGRFTANNEAKLVIGRVRRERSGMVEQVQSMKDCTIGRGMTHVEERADVVHDVKDLAGTTPCVPRFRHPKTRYYKVSRCLHSTNLLDQ